MKYKISVVLTTLLLSSLANASSDLDIMESLSMEEMLNIPISTATGTQKPLSLAPAIATIITDKQISESSARTLDEILAEVPGLNVYNGIGSLSGNYDIRGIRSKYNSQIMILMNGTTLQGVKTGAPIMRLNIPLSAVKRIEIIRGPGSVIYGANAFAGVINIITKDAEYLTDNSEAGIRYGSFDTKELWANYGAKNDNLSYAINFSAASSDGDSNRIMSVDAQTLNDRTFSSNASNAPGPLNTHYERYNLNANFVKDDLELNIWGSLLTNAGTGEGIANALDPNGYGKNKRIQSDLYYRQKLSDTISLEHKVSLSYQKLETYLHVFPAGARLPIGTDGNFGGKPFSGFVTFSDGYIGAPGDEEKTAGYEATLLSETFENHLIRLSGGYTFASYEPFTSGNFGPGVIDGTVTPIDGTLTNLTGTSSNYMPNYVNRKNLFFSIQDEWLFTPNWNLTAGIRYDHFSDFGSAINPRLALVWQTSDTLTTKLLYGRAFRAPSFAELYAQNNPIGNGNPNLQPETIDTYELACDYYPTDKVRTTVNIYYYDAKNLINALGSSFANIGEQTGNGLEYEINYKPIDTITLKAAYAYRNTKLKSTLKEAPDTPKQLGQINANWNFISTWIANTELFWVADRKRAAGDTRSDIPDYTLVNVSVTDKITKDLALNISVRNLFNRTIYDPSPASSLGQLSDYQMPTRSIFAELRYAF
ncbi:MAG: TonB-dependent receptor [Sulfuricurvum sp.]|uniref:TonB-dependent receptor plug domain-containing protein n=1 Tax=Sulfuricurvum sp. TaxID=2025608 RepID=UPI00261E8A73|nr:TonB-dependent receptor [Sulfuricurvum sp.]MDD2828431.1 TonB-dependent receptor [Sulfuricurvum sp.]MDD4949436.1 TonB-dependent receptor [Sulfuricurvum sp.]